MMSANLSLSSLGAQKQNKTRRQQASTPHCLLCVHKKNKKRKDDDERQLVVIFFECKETKQKNNDKHQLVVIFSQCTKTKQQKIMISTEAHCRFLQLMKKKGEPRKKMYLHSSKDDWSCPLATIAPPNMIAPPSSI